MNLFELSFQDMEKIEKWDKEHNCTIDDAGAIGGRLSYKFTPTGLGVIIIVKCACGETLDLTSSDLW